MTWSFLFAVLGAIAIITVAAHEHAKLRASRRTLFDPCIGVLANSVIRHGGDGFPSLDGYRTGRYVRAELIPDSMTIRRLPQLWLKLTRIEVRPQLPEFSILIRPSGTEFYSLTDRHTFALKPPPGLAHEIIARGDGPEAQRLLDSVAPVLRRIFADPKIKEIGVTAKGLRLILQAAEGRRGEHLLFRQCQFDTAAISPEAFAARLDDLDQLSAAIANTEARAA